MIQVREAKPGDEQDILLLIQHNPKPPRDFWTSVGGAIALVVIVFIFLRIKAFLKSDYVQKPIKEVKEKTKKGVNKVVSDIDKRHQKNKQKEILENIHFHNINRRSKLDRLFFYPFKTNHLYL